jgi:hypothetical protein
LPPGGPPANLIGTVMPKPPSANAPKANKNPRDFEGVYVGSMEGLPLPGSGGDAYTPRAKAIVDRRMKLQRHQMSVEGPAQRCRPYDNVTNVAQPVFPMMIVQNEKRVVLITEEGRGVWEIYLDRGHPKTVTPTYNGHSVGHWEGDTLVVDTIGYNGKAYLDLMAGPNSDKAHYSVRITKNIQNGNLNFSYTLEDTAVYTHPKKSSFGLMWNPELKINQFDCESSLGIGTFPGLVPEAQEEAVAASLPD